MNKKIILHIPKYKELWYYEKLLADENTMSYNAGYNIKSDDFEYDNNTGCIYYYKEALDKWYYDYVINPVNKFYAYIFCEEIKAFIGDVNVHKSNGRDYFNMGIVIEHKYRGLGYSYPALYELMKHAFEKLNASEIRNSFEKLRNEKIAIKLHKKIGFIEITDNPNDEFIELSLKKENLITLI